MKVLFIMWEVLVVFFRIFSVLYYGLFVMLPKGIAGFINEGIIDPAMEKYEKWRVGKPCKKHGHQWGPNGNCLRNCGWHKMDSTK